MNSFNVGVLGFTAGNESGNVPGPEKLEPAKQIQFISVTRMTSPKMQLRTKHMVQRQKTERVSGHERGAQTLEEPLFQAD